MNDRDGVEQSGGGWFQLRRWLRRGEWAHAYLFVGPETGDQDQAAEYLASGILCEDRANPPCGFCPSCRRLAHGNHPGLVQVYPDGQSIKIDQLRELQRFFSLRAIERENRVYIIHGADRMTPEAANSLLKFLEEPAPGTVGILTAKRLEGVLATVRSRCQVLRFSAPRPEVLYREWTSRGVGEEMARLFAYLGLSDSGSGEDADKEADGENPLDIAVFADIAGWVVEWVQAVEEQKGKPLLELFSRVGRGQWSAPECLWLLDVLACWYRDVLYTSLGLSDQVVFIDHRRELSSQAARHGSIAPLVERMGEVIDAKRRLQAHANPQLTLERMVLRLQEE
ncbi:DNA polymerase III subunit delta' [Kyrpidia spormannii]|uniref:DNA polymerase III subunit delta n=2 Tax=Kyrpidia spormannii TaxID=2055160 RepID=A0ACA8Z4F2_9BACL|nr:DNA polymerase III subunit delta' [Kyrpidia spormannii]CAB3389223.1 DNA polymerase III subunit delta [Kyrpidia spormannii]CAB3389708.1 DNA polymerase III subunit delta [Kyrpidia spormannii]